MHAILFLKLKTALLSRMLLDSRDQEGKVLILKQADIHISKNQALQILCLKYHVATYTNLHELSWVRN